jgi:hypothetical protein
MPWSSEPWRLVGEAELELGDLGASQAALRRAIGKDGGDWDLWFTLALASEGTARDEALAHAARLNPRSSELEEVRQSLDE